MKKILSKMVEVLSQRLILMFSGILMLFSVILLRFYQLQIIEHDNYINKVQSGVERTIEVDATRGLIFDRYGRSLAINEPTYVVKVDLQVVDNKSLNSTLLEVINVLESNGDEYIDTIPISKEEPFIYTGSRTSINQFMYTIPYNNHEHRQELLALPAEELIEYLYKQYGISNTMTNEDARKVIAIRTTMYPYTYRQYKLPTVATNISEKTVAFLQENYMDFPGVSIDVEYSRYYPYGEIMGNIIGYTRIMTDTLFQELEPLGYDADDVVGHEGIEKSMESILKGEDGKELIQVDTVGRKINTIFEEPAVKGNDVFLTIDIDLQQAVFDSIEKRLSEALIVRLTGSRIGIEPVTARQMLVSMVECSQLLVSKMQNSEEGSFQQAIYDDLVEEYNTFDEVVKSSMTLQDLLLQWITIEESVLTDKQIMAAMSEQGTLQLTDEEIRNIRRDPSGTGEDILIQQLTDGYLKPSQMAIDPFSAAATVIDTNTGEVLALVGYPSVDSNMLSSNFNSYYSTLFDDRSMLWNRSTLTIKAPGSIFKMVSASAGLMEGVITPEDIINCSGVYTKAGEPHPACWVYPLTGEGHGDINLEKAIEVSCNCYFFEVAFRLGEKYTDPYGGINSLTDYAIKFGLNKTTGIELPEKQPNVSTPDSLVRQTVSSILTGLRDMSDVGLNTRTEAVVKTFSKSFFSPDYYDTNTIEGQVDYQVRYDTERELEKLLQVAMESTIDNMVEVAFHSIQGYLQLNLSSIVNEVVNNTMAEITDRSLKLKTMDQMEEQLLIMIGEATRDVIQSVVSNISRNDILEIYENAYTALYESELRQGNNQDIINYLYSKLQTIQNDYREYVAKVEGQVARGLVEAISSYLLGDIYMEWNDGITVRTAIGQGYNAFSPIQMARYIAALANGETVYDLKIVGGIYDQKDTKAYIPTNNKVVGSLDIEEDYIKLIHQGMLDVTQGNSGTSRSIFGDLNIDVAGKTGTAQESSHTHSWFAGFAPVNAPQIVVVTSVYNEDNLGSFGSQIARDVFAAYFKLEQEVVPSTLDNKFLD